MIAKNFKTGAKNLFLMFFSIFLLASAVIFPAKADVIFNSATNYPTVNALTDAIVNWFLSITAGLAILFLIIGGIYYVTAFGDDKRIEEAKKIITYAIFGLVLILISYSVVTTLNSIIFSGASAPITVSAPATIVIPAPAPMLPIAPITAPGTAAPVLTTITVSPATATITVGATQTFTASPKDQNGNPIAAAIVWTSNDAVCGSFSVSSDTHSLTYVAGNTQCSNIVFTAASGGKSGSAIGVKITPQVNSMTISPSNPTIYAGTTQTFTAFPKDGNNNPVTNAAVIWSVGDSSVGAIVADTTDSKIAVFTAAERYDGSTTITATSGGKSATADVVIIY